MNEKFTIITTSYNYQNYIKETIESVISQTYTNWEMIIVDDGSTDNSVEVIKSYCEKDSRIKLYQHENGVNKGMIESMKLGISKASTDWIAFLESDDVITLDYLEKKYDVIKQNPNINFVFNRSELFGNKDAINGFSHIMKQQNRILRNKTLVSIEDFKDINVVLTFSCVMMKKNIFDDIDFNSPVSQWLDYYLWLQIASKMKLYYINETLTKWRMHPNSYNNRKIDEKQSIYFDYTKYKFIYPKLPKFLIYMAFLPKYFKYFRKKIIRFSLRDKTITLFGKQFSW